MKEPNYPDSIPSKFMPLIEFAWSWLAKKYDITEDWLRAKDVEFEFSRLEIKSRHKVYHYGKVGTASFEPVKHLVRIAVGKNTWMTYRKKTVGIYANMTVDQNTALLIRLVHELTHFIQAEQKRGFSEVETTINELQFMYEHRYHYFKQCELIFDNRRTKPNDINCVIC